jgi:hypothetical protein
MGGREARDYWEDRGLVLLWTSMLAGPLAWALNLQVGYALVKWACSRDQTFVLTLVGALTFAGTVAGAYVGWLCLLKVRGTADELGGRIIDRSYFVAVVAVGLNLLLALLIAVSSVHQFMLSPCE